ncbi:DUF5681 domain-containing protein [Methylobacterium sp. E-041]|uniref:DUF5681 domain-containing protein n=1 Tax=Methylobacterium sp. E-041 TaxID=2836573 RepID=UPI001FBBBA7E|nr:DUF5681 domain-containing protein [Methylobacterium sp. E-041]MCJ2109128.1 DUF5681 domain-containing protein [Methylobacterium sp. E-041]
MTARGRPFGENNPGNPAGRPKGARNKTALAIEAILDGEAEALTRRAIELALDGDGPALRLCMDRLAPVRRDRHVQFDLPAIDTTADLPKATHALLQAIAVGELTPSEAADIGKAVDAHVRAIEVTDIHERLARLEEGSPR